MATPDPIAEIIGDYRAFAAMQRDRLVDRGFDIAPYALSHLAVRVADWDLYVHQRTLLERHASANSENLWNGRPISLIVLAEPLDVLGGTPVSLIELIPPVHQRVHRTGLEHLGVVVGEESTTGCRSACSPPPARTRYHADRTCCRATRPPGGRASGNAP